MAVRYLPVFLLPLIWVVGCQAPSGNSSMVDSMPAPSFSGPVMHDTAQPAASYTPYVNAYQPPVAPPTASAPTHTHGDVPAAWTPSAKLNTWKWIVIHHSATPTGGAAAFDKMHRAKGWDELGYHFVIGNGTDTRDGQIEVGSRWPKQKWGAHTKTPDNQFNEHGIGICLVGNFDVSHPSDTQMKALSKLVAYLMKTYHISADHVLGHRDCKSTDCPGRYINIASIRRQSVQMLADAGEAIPADSAPPVADAQMLHDTAAVASR